MYWFVTILEEVRRAHSSRKYAIDGPCDWLNRIFMPTLMIIFCFLNTFNQLVGSNISCLGFESDDKDFAEEYCWTQGIYTHRHAYHMPTQTPYPGVAPCVALIDYHTGKVRFPCNDEEQSDNKAYHVWYQWVPFYYLSVAIAYYMPYLILKWSKLRQVKPLIMLLQEKSNIEIHPKLLVCKVADWIYSQLVYPRYASVSGLAMFWYDYGLVICVVSVKVLYFGAAVAHMFITSRMFSIGDWLSYGLKFGMKQSNTTTHVKDILFPKIVACRIVKWGVTGKVPTTGMCTLALNVMNQYLFLIMWYVNVTLIILNILSCVYTMFKFLNPNIVHQRIVNASMIHMSDDFTRMFGYIGPSGRILVAKMSEHMPGYIIKMIAKKVTKKIDKQQKKHMGKVPTIEFTKIKGQPSEIARQPLMESAVLAFGLVPQCVPMSA